MDQMRFADLMQREREGLNREREETSLSKGFWKIS